MIKKVCLVCNGVCNDIHIKRCSKALCVFVCVCVRVCWCVCEGDRVWVVIRINPVLQQSLITFIPHTCWLSARMRTRIGVLHACRSMIVCICRISIRSEMCFWTPLNDSTPSPLMPSSYQSHLSATHFTGCTQACKGTSTRTHKHCQVRSVLPEWKAPCTIWLWACVPAGD